MHGSPQPQAHDGGGGGGGDIPLLDMGEITMLAHHQPTQSIRRKPLPQNITVSSSQTWRPDSQPPSQPPDHEPKKLVNTYTVEQVSAHDIPHHTQTQYWQPLTLRWPYLLGLLLASVFLLGVLVAIRQYSAEHQGLGNDDGRLAILFAWKFLPTLLAVSYTLLWTMLLEDTKFTEPYARLTRKNGGHAKHTVLQVSGAWWNALVDGFSLEKNDGIRSWTLIVSATSLVLALVVLSPLSSTLLLSRDISVGTPVAFQRINTYPKFQEDYGDQMFPRFRTIGNTLQNATTTAWVNDEYFVVPVWPESMLHPPLSAFQPPSKIMWTAESTVLRSELHCKALHYVNGTLSSYGGGSSSPPGSIVLATDDGCVNNLTIGTDTSFATGGFASWATKGLVALAGGSNGVAWIGFPPTWDFSSECQGDEVILLSTPWVSGSGDSTAWLPDVNAVGQICSTDFYVANIPVSVNVTNGTTFVAFDEQDFRNHRRPVDNTSIGVNAFQELFLSDDWEFHFSPAFGRPPCGGPSAPLYASYGFSLSAVLDDGRLAERAAKIKQRYLGETMMTAFAQMENRSTVSIDGLVSSTQSRILVSSVVALVLQIVLSLEIVLIAVLAWVTRSRLRPLGVHSDPAMIATVAALVSSGTDALDTFRSHQTASETEMAHQMTDTRFQIASDSLLIKNGIRGNAKRQSAGPGSRSGREPNKWRSAALSVWNFVGLLVLLLAIFITIAVLFDHSRRAGLYQKAFVYEKHLTGSTFGISTIAPYSIIPTAIAVGIGIWWGSIETNFKVLQPFISMAKAPKTLSAGVGLSYRSSYLLWAAARAGTHRHWLLSLICAGAFLSQIFTVAMSALWQLESGYRTSNVTLYRSLELRSIPIVDHVKSGTSNQSDLERSGLALTNLFGQLQTNWLYSALLQSTLNSSEPAWSRDGWSFVPVNLSSPDLLVPEWEIDDEAKLTSPNAKASSQAEMTVGITTPAIRARLQCGPYEALSNTSNWLQPRDYANSYTWDTTANPPDVRSGYVLGQPLSNKWWPLIDPTLSIRPLECCGSQTGVLPSRIQPQCCDNATGEDYGTGLLAYWTLNDNSDGGCCNMTAPAYQPINFTVKWIHGTPVFLDFNSSFQFGSLGELGWADVPRMTALNCMPSIETANARVAVVPPSGRVQSFAILDDPQTDQTAWSDYFLRHDPNAPTNESNYLQNTTTSYGYLFLDALLRAADLTDLYGIESSYNHIHTAESLADLNFNFRSTGLNMDFPSYAMYSLVNQSSQALLNQDTLAVSADRVFSTFFQHFVSNDVSLKDGGWAYQPIGTTLPPGFPNVTDTVVKKRDSSFDHAIEAQVSVPIKILRMSPAAAWLCIVILLWLSTTAAIMILLDKRYLGRLVRDARTVADIAVLVAGSDAYLNHIRHGGETDEPLKTKLGWFRDKDGQRRWGIELVGPEHDVKWLDDNGDDGDDGDDDPDTDTGSVRRTLDPRGGQAYSRVVAHGDVGDATE